MLTNTLLRTLINQYSATTKTINIETFDKYLINLDLCHEYHNHNVNKIKGTILEYVTKYYYMSENLEVYMFSEIPNNIREQLKFTKVDNGIDIIYNDGSMWIPVQCKWRENIALAIGKNQLLGFIEESKRHDLDKKMVVVTNVLNLNKYIQEKYALDWILRKDLGKIINKEFIDYITNDIKFKPTIQKEQEKYKLRDCQINALNALTNSKLIRKQCIMFCGTGKSIVMNEYILLKNVNRVVVLMPSLQLIGQFYKILKKYCKNDILCICSKFDKSSLTSDEVDDKQGDNLLIEYLKLEENNILYTTKPNIIAKELKKKKLIVLCTYQSSQLLENYKFDLGLFDEAHKTVNSESFGFALHDKNCFISERVFFTATPKYYKGNNEKCISMDNEKIYGNEIFNYPYVQAKNDGYVLDYQIITYVVPENMEDLVNEKYIKKDNLDVKSEILISAFIIAQHIINNNNSKKILTYHNTIKNAVEFKKTLAYVFFKFDINAKIFTVCGNTSIKTRNEIFGEYESSELAIICSSRVLNEGVDLPCTDTIAFVDPRSGTIDVTQCFGRADRIFGDQQICSIIIPVHYNQLEGSHNYSDTVKILSAMGDIDNKIIMNFANKNINNKINIVQMNCECIKECDIVVKYNLENVINNLGIAITGSKILGFEYKINLLFKYCVKYECAPQYNTIYENQTIGSWLQDKKKKINSIENELYKKLSINEYVKANLDNYLIKFKQNEGIINLSFEQGEKLLFAYCNFYGCMPKEGTKYENRDIYEWLKSQKKKINSSDDELYKKLAVNKYVKISLDKYLIKVKQNEGKIKLNFNQWQNLLFEFSDDNKGAPKCDVIYDNQTIGLWLQEKKKKINSVDDNFYKKLSENQYVKKNLDDYLRKLNQDVNLEWDICLNLLFIHCNENGSCPTQRIKYENKDIYQWLNNQKKGINNVDNELYKKLSVNIHVKIYLDKYLKKIKDNEGKIKLNYNQWENLLFEFSDKYECVPSKNIIYENQKIGSWLQEKKKKINSINDEFYKKLSMNNYVKKNLDKYLIKKNNLI